MDLALKPLNSIPESAGIAWRSIRERAVVSLYAPFRVLIAAAAALAIATLFASWSVHAVLLGDAIVRSAPGAPLRVVIPLKPTPGEALETGCFRLVSNVDT